MAGRRSDSRARLSQYQKECVDAIKTAYISRQNVLLSIAIGFGRSVIIVQALTDLLATKKVRRALFVASRNVLLDSFSYMLSEHLLENVERVDVSKEYSTKYLEHKFEEVPILLSSLNMFRREVARFPSNFFDLVFLNECHDLSKTDWEILEAMKSTIVGFTSNHYLLVKPEVLSFFDVERPTYSYGISAVKLKDLTNVFLGANYSSADLSGKGFWKFIRPRDVRDNRIRKVTTFISKRVADRNPKCILVEGDILLQNIFDFSRIAIVEKKDLPAIASRNFFVIRSKTVSPDFLFDYLQSETVRLAFQKQLEDLAHGFIRRVNLADVKEILVPVPFSAEHLNEFVRIKHYQKLPDLTKAREEIRKLRRAYQKHLDLGD